MVDSALIVVTPERVREDKEIEIDRPGGCRSKVHQIAQILSQALKGTRVDSYPRHL